MAEQVYLAVDLGASSGRVLAGQFNGARLNLEEVHRFENQAVAVGSHLHWDILRLWTDVANGLRAGAAKWRGQVRGVAVDTWGVDFALLGRQDVLLGNPYSYRDARTQGMLERAFAIASREEIFRRTGLQFMQINSLYQLLAMRLANSPLLEVAEHLLLIPDLFHWLLTGVKANEFTNATTTQFYDPTKKNWAKGLLAKLELPTHLLGEIVAPGTKLGKPIKRVGVELDLPDVEVIAPGTHDTASAVLAAPADSAPSQRPNWCYISSGTWSLMGVETPAPVINDRCLSLNFTNEGGVGGTTRLLKNITGLWLLQECRRIWARQGREYSWEQLSAMATRAPRLAALAQPDHASFQAPGDMPEALRNYCRLTGQTPPADDGAITRMVIESLALRCRQVLGWLEELTEGRIETIHILGGGSQNRPLCQATADACQRRVLAGPAEATSIGNLMSQAIALGAVGSIAEARAITRASFPLDEYSPKDANAWNEAYVRFQSLV